MCIRGYSTLGNNDLLFIIDGVPTTAGLNTINPQDIGVVCVIEKTVRLAPDQTHPQ